MSTNENYPPMDSRIEEYARLFAHATGSKEAKVRRRIYAIVQEADYLHLDLFGLSAYAVAARTRSMSFEAAVAEVVEEKLPLYRSLIAALN